MIVTFSMLVRDLEKRHPNLKNDLVFGYLKTLANLRMYRDQGMEVDGLLKDYEDYVNQMSSIRKRLLEE